MITMIKICSRCGEEKDIKDFYVRNASKDGRSAACKVCLNIEHRKWEHTLKGRKIRRVSQKKRRATPKGKQKTREYNKTSMRTQIFSRARTIADRRGQSWNLSKNQYLKLISRPCHYCEGPLPTGGIGLDRIDNEQGYVKGNVLQCCTQCNCARADFFSVSEMETLIGPAIKAVLALRG